MIKFHFVIPTYRENKNLENCLKSLLNQTYDAKILITTSTPTPYSKKIADKYQIPFIVQKEAQTIANDSNFALNQIEEGLVNIAHQDDIYERDYAQRIVESFQEEPNSLILFTDYYEIKNNQIIKNNLNLIIKRMLLAPFLFKKHISSGFFKKRLNQFGSAIACPSVTYNKDLLPDFKFDNNFRINLDWKAWYDLAERKGDFSYINKKLMGHRISLETETTYGINSKLRAKEDLEMFLKYWKLKSIANLIAKIYSLSYLNNKQQPSKNNQASHNFKEEKNDF